ncbi:hypothetical protein F511_09678 [Dorcoceras hygrometricum]|uniref:Uncharacterized protein n=1 Tax=Dorcoceras hygrometricum TaxID=472368 RepID=A0A2Z7ANC1_9LAMI|nr:hypothetical protein F511_09678 [Dorcoceras hygrometricum]
MSNVEQEADNSKRNSEESDVVLKNQQMVRVQQMATVQWIQQKRKDKDSADEIISRKIYQQRASTSSWYLELAIAKRCRLHKLIRQRFAFVLWIQQMLFAMRKTSSRKDPDATIISAAAQRRVKSGQLRRRNDTQLLQRNQRSRWKESMAEIESCKLPQSREQDLYYSGKEYNLQRSVARKWKDDNLDDDQLECKSNVNQQLVATVHSDESYSRPAVDMHPVAKIQTQR